MPENEVVLPTSAATDTPTWTIRIEGTPLDRTFQLLSVVTQHAMNRIASARLLFEDGDPAACTFAASASDWFVPGKAIEILGGYHSQETVLFSGLILRHAIQAKRNGRSTLQLDCRHAAVKMTRNRISRVFSDMTDSDIITQIGSDHGLDVDLPAPGTVSGDCVQFQATDWDFLVNRAEMNGWQVLPAPDGKLSVKAPDFSATPTVTLRYGATILECDLRQDSFEQLNSVTARSWDPSNQQVQSSESESNPGPQTGNLSAESLAQSLGINPPQLWHPGPVTPAELTSWASAQYMKSRLSQIAGRIRCQGIDAVAPGDQVALQGLGDRFNGNAWVSGVRQEYGNGTWTTDLNFGDTKSFFTEENDVTSPPASGQIPGIHGLMIGVVTNINDPLCMERIQIRIPALADEGNQIWARMAYPEAGNNRGYIFRPEVEDEVVVGFQGDDPRYPIILGCLYSAARPAPLPLIGDNDLKGIVTRTGLKLVFDDSKPAVSLETPAGKKLCLDDDAGSIVIQDENGNIITLDSNGVSIDSGSNNMKFNSNGDVKISGMNVTIEAQAQLTANGSAGAELSSCGSAVVKGSIVQIN